MSLPDPVERGEARAEAALDALTVGGTYIHCPACNMIFDFETEGGPLSPDPYAPPVCGKCLEEAMHNAARDSANFQD